MDIMNTDDQTIFKNLCKGEIQQRVIKFVKKFQDKTPSNKDYDIFLEYLLKSFRVFLDFVTFVDCFDRTSKSFQIMLGLSSYMISLKHPKYVKYYKKLLKESPPRLISGYISDELILKSERK
jgi:hypothetical protein